MRFCLASHIRWVRFVIVTAAFLLALGASNIVMAAPTDDFVITVKTDNPGASSNTQFTIPTAPGGGYNYNVDCNNDGTNEATGRSGDYTCSYGAAGTYTIRIKDNNAANDGLGFPRIYFNGAGDAQKLLTVAQWGFMKWKSMAGAFYGCSNMTVTATDAPDLTGVTDMSQMFLGALTFNGNIGSWDTSNVTDMTAMFAFAVAFNQNIGNWNTANVTSMSSMFSGATAFNRSIGGWNTAKVTNMSEMFSGATAFNQNLGGWNVSALEYATNMFSGVTLDTANYDALLNGWDAGALKSGVTFGGGNSKYCLGETARAHMIASDAWTITDGGKDCADLRVVNKAKELSATSHRYKLRVINLDASKSAVNVTVTDKLPKGYKVTKVTSDTAQCNVVKRTVTCSQAQLDAGSAVSIVIVAQPNSAAGNNCAIVTATTPDPNTANNKSCVNVP